MTKEEEREHYEQHQESNLRFIRAKLPSATPMELGLLAAFIQGLGIAGWSDSEYNRDI